MTKSRTPDLPYRAAVFDLDGVITDTRRLHVAAWKEMIDDYLERRNRRDGDDQPPFDPGEDYEEYVDGKPRYQGLASFLESRGIDLPRGEPSDPPDRETVCGLGNRKQEIFRRLLDEEGPEVIAPMADLVRDLRRRGVAVAYATSSRNGEHVVAVAGLTDLWDAAVDGRSLDEMDLSGKPDPDMFQEAVRRLDADPADSLLFEDARAGVEAGRRGGFALVVGVAGGDDDPEPLERAGADLVVDRQDPPDPDRLAEEVRRSPGGGRRRPPVEGESRR